MATVYIYNAFGDYDQKGEERGTALRYGGIEFFFPYQKVTPIPNWIFRNVDHGASTAPIGEVATLTYATTILDGRILSDELLNLQVPVKNRDKGLLPITGKSTGKMVEVPSGVDSDGNRVMVEVMEKEPTRTEVTEAEKLAAAYKHMIVQQYFDSKRNRMTGGNGRLFPDPTVRRYMDELGVEDLDDVTSHAKQAGGGLTVDLVNAIVKATRESSEITYAQFEELVNRIRKADGPQLAKSRPKPLDLAAHAARYDAEQAAKGVGQ